MTDEEARAVREMAALAIKVVEQKDRQIDELLAIVKQQTAWLTDLVSEATRELKGQ